MRKKPKFLVVGSMNMDLFVKGINTIANYGESIACGDYGFAAGGKGANQAIAAALQGAEVTMVGRVGNDMYGDQLIAKIEQASICSDFVVRDPIMPTCLALMLVHDDGRYVSYTPHSANHNLSEDDVLRAFQAKHFDMVLMQLEVPLETIFRTYELANQRNIPVFLDAGPAMNISLDRLRGLHIISPNEVEARALTGITIDNEENAVKAAQQLYKRVHPKYVILKMGSRGALVYDGVQANMTPCFNIPAVDSTAAGDTFGAALAVRLCKGEAMEEAVRYAHVAAGICVSRVGAQISIPSEEEVTRFLREGSLDYADITAV